MNKAILVAQNTYREIMRDRILYGLVIFAVLLMGLALALSQLSTTEQGRMALDFGLAGVQLSSLILAVFTGSVLVAKEIEKQTILTLLSRPLSRSTFIWGKFLGLVAVIVVILVGLSLILAGIGVVIEAQLGISYVIGILGILLEALVLLSITMFFGVILRPFLTVACTIGAFLIGHSVNSLGGLIEKNPSETFRLFVKVLGRVMPNLEMFNWRTAVVYQDNVPLSEIATAFGYAASWTLALMFLTILVFRRKDFV